MSTLGRNATGISQGMDWLIPRPKMMIHKQVCFYFSQTTLRCYGVSNVHQLRTLSLYSVAMSHQNISWLEKRGLYYKYN